VKIDSLTLSILI
jgi:peroxidase